MGRKKSKKANKTDRQLQLAASHEYPRTNLKQPKSFAVRLPGRESEFEALCEALRDSLAVDSARLVLAGAVAGLSAIAESDLAAAESYVRSEMARRNMRREVPSAATPDYKSHLYSVRLGPIETAFEQLKASLKRNAPDIDASNQMVIAAAVGAYLPVSPQGLEDISKRIRDLVRSEYAEAERRRFARKMKVSADPV